MGNDRKGKVLSMITSVQHFCQNGTKNLEKVMVDYSADIEKLL